MSINTDTCTAIPQSGASLELIPGIYRESDRLDATDGSVTLALTMPRRVRALLFTLVVIVVLTTLALALFSMGRTPPHPPLPFPNGYDDFLKAASLLTGDVYQLSTLDHDGLGALVFTNVETLRLLRLGLTRQCSVPADSAMTNVPGMMSDLAHLKSLARLLMDEGQLAEMENRNADAAQSYLDAIRFGNEMSRGGFIINRLVGIACEAIGCSPLVKLVPKLKRDEARAVITALEKIDAARVSWDEVLQNENRFSRYQLRKGFNLITWAMTRWERWRSMQQSAVRHKKVIAHERLLAAELALRCYQSEQGEAPARLDDLVINYLSKVPQDPFSGRPLTYRPQGTNWLLYSIGPDGLDDGGRPVGQGSAKGDILFDSPW